LDPSTAKAVVDAVFEETAASARRCYIEFLAHDIGLLASIENKRWGVTLQRWGVRLNAGPVECLVLDSGGLRVLVDKDSAPRRLAFDDILYARVPNCRMTKLPLSTLPRSLPRLEEPHHHALTAATNWPSLRNVRTGHSPGVIAFLSAALGARLPNPSYCPGDERLTEDLDEIAAPATFLEGGRAAVLVNRFERDPAARQACIAHYGCHCVVCEMTFAERYGESMQDFIHVHHLAPLSAIRERYQVDPINDLRPVCPNCHAAIHRREPPLTIEQARALLTPVASR
jgi:hypothetical protein